MKSTDQLMRTSICISLPSDVVQALYAISNEEEAISGIKRNLSSIIYRAIKAAHPAIPQYDIDLVFKKRQRNIPVFVPYKNPTPLNLDDNIIYGISAYHKKTRKDDCDYILGLLSELTSMSLEELRKEPFFKDRETILIDALHILFDALMIDRHKSNEDSEKDQFTIRSK